MTANAPHRTTSEYSTCGAESISKITIVKEFISDHVIVVVILGEANYEFVALLKPFGMSSALTDIIHMPPKWRMSIFKRA